VKSSDLDDDFDDLFEETMMSWQRNKIRSAEAQDG
jgi:hypothetical protein